MGKLLPATISRFLHLLMESCVEIEKFAEKTYDGEKVFLITKNVGDMAALVAAGVEIRAINVGNVAKHEGSRPIKKSVELNDTDIAQIKEIIGKGIPVTAQMIPNESDQSILNRRFHSPNLVLSYQENGRHWRV